ncbi:Rft protein-domain-containing protein [Neurospora hispaniola]|uniref:Man(5)GlcNAc(2)-PP-dolichol translocation protein RFT1 n=1 Tax=Neurospora hispaniola TaxID=588809 RepID=A0AAJ0MN98_9PEZI|nr:Rft protein-domain-containing protein [Neurospora hispaniola]
MADLKEPPGPTSPPSPPPPTATTTTRALRGASLLILLQILSRALTFIANQILLRFLTASLLGVSTQLEVYYLSVIFFARESLRVAIQRQDTTTLSASLPSSSSSTSTSSESAKDRKDGKSEDGKDAAAAATQAVINLSHLSLLLSLPLSFLFGRVYLSSLSLSTLQSTPYLVPSLYLYGLAAILELLSEPCFAVMQIRFQFGVRAAAESVATFLRCAVTLGIAVWGARTGREMGTLPFAVGQCVYAVGLLAVYLWKGWKLSGREGFSLWPRRLLLSGDEKQQREELEKDKSKVGGGKKQDLFVLGYFYRPTLDLASSLMAQSVVKHILTQGDTFLVSILSTPTAQGVYALANNYGGLLARLVFQPVEESSRSYFSRLLADSTTSPSPSSPSSTSPSSPSPSSPSSKPSSTALHQASTSLTTLLKSYLLLSLPLLVFGPPASSPLLTLIAGRRWTSSSSSATTVPVDSAPATLSLYMYYIPLLALNGILEAFVSSVASEAQVHQQSLFMTAFSLVFAGTGYLTLKVWGMGARGLVVANAVNMACRIGWCWGFVGRWFAERTGAGKTGEKGGKEEEEEREKNDGEGGKEKVRFGVLDVLPKPGAVAAAVVARSVVGRVVGAGQQEVVMGAKEAVWELFKIAGVAVPFVVAVAIAEREFLLSGYRALQGKRQQQKS